MKRARRLMALILLLLQAGCGAPVPSVVGPGLTLDAPEEDADLRGYRIGPVFSDPDRSPVPKTTVEEGATPRETGIAGGRVALVSTAGLEPMVVVYEANDGTVVPRGPQIPWYGPAMPHVSADGRYVIYNGLGRMGRRIVLWDMARGEEVALPDEVAGGREPDLSGDGSRLIYLKGTERAPTLAIFDRDRREERLLPIREAQLVGAHSPTLSADGGTAAYVASSSRGDANLMLLDLESGRPISPPTLNTVDQERDPALSADGNTLLFTSDRNGTLDLFAYDLKEGRYMDMGAYNSLGDDTLPRFVGPADEGVAYVSDREGSPTGYMRRYDGWR